MVDSNRFLEILDDIYGGTTAAPVLRALLSRTDTWREKLGSLLSANSGLSERDAMLITYGDQVQAEGEAPLHTLHDFLQRHLEGTINCLHILPFYPYSSDDGFSVIDFREVSPKLGTWADIENLSTNFRLMFDAVINHVSAQSEWFEAFLKGEEPYQNYFIEVRGKPDLSKVVRPRALPLVHRLGKPPKTKTVWTTFSADQVDLNYRSPQVLLEIIDLLLYYVSKGAEFIRLDAIAYLWKEIGTACIHLPQTHRIIQLLRAVMDEVAPHVKLITETNVPHKDNISYFGDGTNEAQLVYNFALPPLVLHTFHTGNASDLSRWANELTLPSEQVTFFNFLASHDGIGINPVRGILPDAAIENLVERVLAHGGLVSYKHNPDGTTSPYELNINYFDALSNPNGSEPLDLQVNRFMAAQGIMLAMVGLPGIYFHSFFGSRGWPEGVKKTIHNRTINRQKFTRTELEQDLGDENTLRSKVVKKYRQFLRARQASPAFHPYGRQEVLNYGDDIFALLSCSSHTDECILCLVNVTDRLQSITLKAKEIFGHASLADLLGGQHFEASENLTLELSPYQTYWLTVSSQQTS